MLEEIQTAEELRKLQARLEQMWAERNREIEFFRRLRFMEIIPKVPVAYEAHTVRLSKAHMIIERMTGMLTTNPISLHVPPAASTAKALEASSKIEKWMKLGLERLQKQIGEDNIERLVEHLLLDAHACMRVLYARNYWEDRAGKRYPRRKKNETDEAFDRRTRRWYPRRREGEEGDDYNKRTEEWKKGRPLPISWTVLDPLTVYPLFTEMGLVCVLETGRRTTASLRPGGWQLKKESPELWELVRTKAQEDAEVEFTQVWYPNTLIYAVNGEIVHRQKHHYGAPPYIYATGIGSTQRSAAKTALSVLYGLRHVLPKLDEVLTQKATAVALYGWPTPVWTIGDKRVVAADGDLSELAGEFVPGELFPLWPDEKLGFIEYKGTMPDVDELIGLLMGEANQGGLAQVLHGLDPTGESGYRLNQLISAAKTKFKPIIRHAERALEQVVQAICDIIEFQVREPLYVYSSGKDGKGWVGLGPDDLKGYREVEVKLDPIMPTDTYARSSKAIMEVGARIQSRRGAMEDTGKEQPEEVENQIWIEAAKDDPQARQFLIKQAVERAGVELAEKKEMAISELLQLLPSLPPAFQQAILMVMQGAAAGPGQPGLGGMPGQPGMRPPPVGVTAAPGVAAVPGTPTPTPGAMRGRIVRPSGIGTGRAPGTRRGVTR